MGFASRITRMPIALDAARGQSSLAALGPQPDRVAELIKAAAGSSPYLAGLIGKEASWLKDALAACPDGKSLVLDELSGADELSPEALGPLLRQAKRRIALYTALADLGGVWALEDVTRTLTLLADRACDLAFNACLRREAASGKLPESTGRHGGLIILAMGKMGAAELNYSSDIDLIVLFDADCYAEDLREKARAALIRVTRQAVALLSRFTEHGYVFRVDLRLRPDASMTPVCLSTASALAYYEAEGRSWERAAFIKARPCAGDIEAGEVFLNELSPFVWRRHLDFAAIEDAHSIRLRIRDHRNLKGKICAQGHDIKLGQGGIREIEFFAQTQQLIAGGRDPFLRPRGTLEALTALADRNWITQSLAQELSDHYREHRLLEHRIQMVNDAQTHILPEDGAALDAVACLASARKRRDWLEGITHRLVRVEALTNAFFAPSEQDALPVLSTEIQTLVDGWRSYPALKSVRARQVFRRIEGGLLSAFQNADNPAEAVARFDGFIKGLPAGVQIFSLFEANPHLIDLIVDICATAPRLAIYLSGHSSVLDAVLAGSFFEPWPQAVGMRALLAHEILKTRSRPGAGYEDCLDTARQFAHEWQFRVGVHYLRGLIDADTASAQYTDIADAVVQAMTAEVSANFSKRHGPLPGRGAVIVAMGSAGARQMHASSDLDLLCLYDAGDVAMSDGEKPLPVRQYYARWMQALVTALSVPTAAGRLYEVDMRLRPSGRHGPVATSITAFYEYQYREAWVWEHLALTRARPVSWAGAGTKGDEIERLRLKILQQCGKRQAVLPELALMRRRLLDGKRSAVSCGFRAGRGRLQDLELFAQSLALRCASKTRCINGQIIDGLQAGLITRSEADDLLAAVKLLWTAMFAGRLLTDRTISADTIGEGGQKFLLGQLGFDSMVQMSDALETAAERAASVIDKYAPIC